MSNTCLGQATIAAWKGNGSPDKKPEKSKDYINNMFMALLSVKAHLTHGTEGCPTVKQLTAVGVEIAK